MIMDGTSTEDTETMSLIFFKELGVLMLWQKIILFLFILSLAKKNKFLFECNNCRTDTQTKNEICFICFTRMIFQELCERP